jgi:hypothetical protein
MKPARDTTCIDSENIRAYMQNIDRQSLEQASETWYAFLELSFM